MIELEYLESLGFVKNRSESGRDYYYAFIEVTVYFLKTGIPYRESEHFEVTHDIENNMYSLNSVSFSHFEAMIETYNGFDSDHYRSFKKLQKRKTIINKIIKLC